MNRGVGGGRGGGHGRPRERARRKSGAMEMGRGSGSTRGVFKSRESSVFLGLFSGIGHVFSKQVSSVRFVTPVEGRRDIMLSIALL